MRIDLTSIQIGAVLTHLRDTLGEEPDEQLVLDSLEGETDAFELIRKLLDQIEADEGDIAALVSQIGDRNERKARAEKRKESRREAIMALLECAQLDRLQLPEATLTLRRVAPKPIVENADLVPDALCAITRKPKIKEIRDLPDAHLLPGMTLDNGGVSLTVRRR